LYPTTPTARRGTRSRTPLKCNDTTCYSTCGGACTNGSSRRSRSNTPVSSPRAKSTDVYKYPSDSETESNFFTNVFNRCRVATSTPINVSSKPSSSSTTTRSTSSKKPTKRRRDVIAPQPKVVTKRTKTLLHTPTYRKTPAAVSSRITVTPKTHQQVTPVATTKRSRRPKKIQRHEAVDLNYSLGNIVTTGSSVSSQSNSSVSPDSATTANSNVAAASGAATTPNTTPSTSSDNSRFQQQLNSSVSTDTGASYKINICNPLRISL